MTNYLKPELLQENVSRYLDYNVNVLVSAGFEDRTQALFYKFKAHNVRINSTIVIDYENSTINEPNRSSLLRIASEISNDLNVVTEGELLNNIDNIINEKIRSKLIIDITGMSRLQFYNIMNCLSNNNIRFDIAYSEAEKYYPDKEFYERLKIESHDNEDLFFNAYQKEADAEMVYSFDCEIIQPIAFRGRPEPGRSAALVGFLTFKRSRLQSILRRYEFSKRFLILGEPVRDEIKWRKEMMELINGDLLKKRDSEIFTMHTLYPQETYDLLDRIIYQSGEYKKYNIYLAPLGSKMQTLGTYIFWRNHQEIATVFSQPKKYFINAYSHSWKDTFIIKSENLIKLLQVVQ